MYRVVDGVIVSEKEFEVFANEISPTIKRESVKILRECLSIPERGTMKAEALYGKPILIEITVTFNPKQAERLIQFLGQTGMDTVEGLLKDLDRDEVYAINSVIFDLYDALTNAMPENGDW